MKGHSPFITIDIPILRIITNYRWKQPSTGPGDLSDFMNSFPHFHFFLQLRQKSGPVWITHLHFMWKSIPKMRLLRIQTQVQTIVTLKTKSPTMLKKGALCRISLCGEILIVSWLASLRVLRYVLWCPWKGHGYLFLSILQPFLSYSLKDTSTVISEIQELDSLFFSKHGWEFLSASSSQP